MPAPEERGAYVYGPGLHRIFAAGGAFLLATVVWMIAQDFNRPWKVYQRHFRELKKERLEKELAAEKLRTDAEVKRLTSEKQTAESNLEKQAETIRKLEADLDVHRRQALYKAKQTFQFAKAEYDTARYFYEQAAAQPDAGAAGLSEKAQMDRRQAEMEASQEELKKAELQERDLKASLDGHQEARNRAEKNLKELTRQAETTQNNIAKLKMSLANLIRDLPMLDFVDPNLKVRQKVLEDLRLDYHFATVYTVDRCETCHVAIDDRDWDRNDPRWQGKGEQPYVAHSRLDLFLHAASPHPADSFGCTSCHMGRGPATDFVRATHMPDSKEEGEEWEKEHGWSLHHWDIHYWHRPMLPAKFTQAGCQKCHGTDAHLPGGEKLLRGRALFRDFGCYGCHKTEGFNDAPVVGEIPKRGPDLMHVQAKLKPGWMLDWIWNPKAFRPSTRMPRFFGQANNSKPEDEARERTDVRAIVEFLWNKSNPLPAYPAVAGGDGKRGERLVKELGCLGCHRVTDPPAETERTAGKGLRDHGPELSRIGAKTTPEWIAAWVRDPRHYSKNSRMPNLRLTSDEARDVAVYLGGLVGAGRPEESLPPRTDAELRELDKAVRRVLAADQTEIRPQARMDEEVRTLSVQAKVDLVGKTAVRRYGCAGCHDIPGFETEKKIGVELSGAQPIGSKPLDKLDYGLIGEGHGGEEFEGKAGFPKPPVPHTLHDWIFRKLKNPRVYDWGKEKPPEDRLRMPDFEMSDEEAECLITFLLGLTRDQVPAAKRAPTSGPTAAEQRGWRLVQEWNCIGCHQVGLGAIRRRFEDKDADGRPRTTEVTVKGRVTDRDEENVYFQLWVENPHPSAGNPPKKLVIPKGDVIWETPEVGGALLPVLAQHYGLPLEVARPQAPPVLVGEGDKVQPKWLFGFLKAPEMLRPWLKTRMPTFPLSDDQANALAEFFVAAAWREGEVLRKSQLDLARASKAEGDEAKKAKKALTDRLEKPAPYAFPYEEIEVRSPAYLAMKESEFGGYLPRARRLFEHKDVNCQACHVRGSQNPAGDPAGWAPDLSRVPVRLRPSWFVREAQGHRPGERRPAGWLVDPQGVLPGTKMPSFEWSRFADVFPGKNEARIQALRDLLFNPELGFRD
ncbi:MAG: c-type cytochrome [Planctomycetales bacterium]|nr:c-type cytochrome [Planctomycetales bacterium]